MIPYEIGKGYAVLIGIDASPAGKDHKTGIEWYCHYIVEELAKLDTANRYRIYTKVPIRQNLAAFPDNFTEVVLPDRSFWTHTALAKELKQNPVDVFYSPGHIIPWRHPRRTISTIHDAGFRHYRKSYSLYQYLHATGNSWSSVKWSSKVIVPSQFVADDIATIYNLKGKQVAVIPNGFDPAEFVGITPEEIAAARAAHNITAPYLIFIGRMDSRKNLLRALQAYFRLVNEEGLTSPFVLIGAPGIGYDEIEAFIAGQKRSDLIVRTGYVDARVKAALLAGSRAMIFPSLYEGFGIPILEGFAAGTPVLTGTLTSCPEVAGDAALLVDPMDVDAIAAGMRSLLSDDALCRSLVARGKERAKLYSWEITTRAVHKLLAG